MENKWWLKRNILKPIDGRICICTYERATDCQYLCVLLWLALFKLLIMLICVRFATNNSEIQINMQIWCHYSILLKAQSRLNWFIERALHSSLGLVRVAHWPMLADSTFYGWLADWWWWWWCVWLQNNREKALYRRLSKEFRFGHLEWAALDCEISLVRWLLRFS